METKTLNIVTALIVLITFGLYSCKDLKDDRKKDEDTEQEKGTVIEDGAYLKKTISFEYAKKLEEEYINTRANIINKYLDFNEGEEDAREFLFDIETLKSYIAYVEREGKKMGYNNLGIRIYNGAYPNTKGFPDPGYATVFLVPTGTKTKSKGSFLPLTTTVVADENIKDLKALNYARAGRPPKDLE